MTDVREYLRKVGVPPEEIARAEAGGPQALQLLALDRTLLPGEARYTQAQVAEGAGVPLEVARRFWLAMGFVEPPVEEPAFTEGDVEALRLVKELLPGRSRTRSWPRSRPASWACRWPGWRMQPSGRGATAR